MSIECPKCRTKNSDTVKFCGECGTRLESEEYNSFTKTLETPIEALKRGTLFAGRYEIIEKLGEGGMGAVYRVEDTKVGEEVALKLINPLVASDKQTIQRFRNELKFARKIRHKHVCQMFDLGEDEGTHFITMEYVAGEDLKSFLKRSGKLTIEMAVRVAKQIVDGLAEAHRIGIVHRDLKPSNIMIDKEGHARIMDFGIARSMRSKGLTGAGLVIGTPEYMSPEQAEGKEADVRSDIYSIGVILFEILTGQKPFEGDSALGIAMKHKGEEPKEPRQLNPNIPESVNNLVLKCLKKNPADRYHKIEEMLEELTALDLEIPAAKTSGRQISGLISKEITVSFSIRKFILPFAAIIIAIAGGLFIWRPWIRRTTSAISSGKPTLAIVYFRNISGDSAIDDWSTDFADYLMVDLGQSKYINVIEEFKIYSTLQDLDLLKVENYSETDLRKICEAHEASHILKGSFLKSGAKYEVNATLLRADTLESLGAVVAEVETPNEMHSLVDQLTPKIKLLFGFTDIQIADDIDLGIGEIRTESKDAWDYYVKGIIAGDVENNTEQAIKFFRKSLEFDPEFGRAWIALSINNSNLGKVEEARKYAEKAIELGGKMTVKELHLAEAALYARSEKTLDKMFIAYQEILRDYPDDVIANANSGFHYFILEEYDESIKYNGSLYGRKTNPVPYFYLSKANGAQGLYDKAKECLEFYIRNVKDVDLLHAELALVYLCQGDKEKALLELEKSPKSDPTLPHLYALGLVHYYMEDFKEAEKSFEELKLSQGGWYQFCAYKNLHNTLLAQGRFKEAKTQLENGIDFTERENITDYDLELYAGLMYNHLKSGQAQKTINIYEKSLEAVQNAGALGEALRRRLLYLKGMAALEMEELKEAQAITTSLKELIDSGRNKKAIRIFYHLSGLIEERNGNRDKALKYYSDALELAPLEHDSEVYLRVDRAPYLESIGKLYFKMGELDKATEQFEKIQDMTLGRLDYGDIYAASYYNLGMINEQKGWVGKAIEHYEKFLDLWQSADPGLPEVEDAKQRLAGLRN